MHRNLTYLFTSLDIFKLIKYHRFMQREDILKISKEIITEELGKAGYKVLEIILFGSRARGDESPDSDWDFYVVIDKDIDFKTKKSLIATMQMKLAENYIFCDILLNDIKNYERLSREKSTVSYVARIEGIAI